MSMPDPAPVTQGEWVSATLLHDDRADKAWALRVAGLSWAGVARQAGYADASNAARAVRHRYGTLPEPERTELRKLWRERLETLWLQSTADVAQQRTGAVTAAVRVAQAAAALDGLNAPTRVETHVTETFAGLLVELRGEDLL